MIYKKNNFVVIVLLYYIIIILLLYYIYFLLPRQCHRHAAGRVKKCQSSALCNLLITYRNIAVDTVCASTSPHCSLSSTFSVNLSSSQTNSFVFPLSVHRTVYQPHKYVVELIFFFFFSECLLSWVFLWSRFIRVSVPYLFSTTDSAQTGRWPRPCWPEHDNIRQKHTCMRSHTLRRCYSFLFIYLLQCCLIYSVRFKCFFSKNVTTMLPKI